MFWLRNKTINLGFVASMCSKSFIAYILTHITVMFIGPVKQFFVLKIEIISLPIRLNICFGCSKELSH